ncbi:MAG: type II toxin-antitoxin system HicB family antitoxin [Solirubrobacteraceae bacterium]
MSGCGSNVYAPELPGLHTQGDTLEEATESAREALELYVEGLREDGRSLEMGIGSAYAAAARVSERLPVLSGQQPIDALEKVGWAAVSPAR